MYVCIYVCVDKDTYIYIFTSIIAKIILNRKAKQKSKKSTTAFEPLFTTNHLATKPINAGSKSFACLKSYLTIIICQLKALNYSLINALSLLLLYPRVSQAKWRCICAIAG